MLKNKVTAQKLAAPAPAIAQVTKPAVTVKPVAKTLAPKPAKKLPQAEPKSAVKVIKKKPPPIAEFMKQINAKKGSAAPTKTLT